MPKLTRWLASWTAFALLAILPLQAEEPFLVLTTTTDLADISQNITGALARVESLADGQEDPHSISVRPSFIIKARATDVWLRIGMELEIGWEPPILRDSRNRNIQPGTPGHIDVAEAIIPLDVPTQKVTRDMGDIHPQGNPHYWLDPLNGRLAAKYIAERLGKLYPQHQSAFQQNLQQYLLQLDSCMFGQKLVECCGGAQLWQWFLAGELQPQLDRLTPAASLGGWCAALKPFAGDPVATYHRSWIYLLNRFQLQMAAELEPKPGVPPSPRHLATLSKKFQQEGVRVILQEPFYSRKAAEMLASRCQLQVVVCPNTTQGSDQAGTYLTMLDNVIKNLATTLRHAGSEL